MNLNQKGIDLIKFYEGFRAAPYLDFCKIPTIGYGCTYYPDGRKVTLLDSPVTEEQASELLQEILQTYFCPNIERLIKVDLNDNQFSALVSFAYNLGLHSLEKSTLLKYVNSENYAAASREFLKWSKANGTILLGLLQRRKEETQLFLMPA
jgi:lysozyme